MDGQIWPTGHLIATGIFGILTEYGFPQEANIHSHGHRYKIVYYSKVVCWQAPPFSRPIRVQIDNYANRANAREPLGIA